MGCEMVAAIFLDIDGVICCNLAGRLEESKLLALHEIVKATSAKVVLSTDWRRQAQLKRQVIVALKRFDMEVIGATPMKAMFQPIRPVEIVEWMNVNGAKFGIDAWVAIDDRDLTNEHGGAQLVGHFVRTHPNTGLTKRLAEACIALLQQQSSSVGPAPEMPPPSTPSSTSEPSGLSGLASTAPARLRPPRTGTASSPARRAPPTAGRSTPSATRAGGRAPAVAGTAAVDAGFARLGIGGTPTQMRASAPTGSPMTPATRRANEWGRQRGSSPKRWSGATLGSDALPGAGVGGGREA